ncbi:unnamed protein product [Trichogramma brassicae]|uniref:RRM domain-containing protein n=1 Tax=Trichogramma brassicae TaxID=86971 RepID=A0A6H5I6P7_9HYME|nr:unnamed protein product [Trichogramma brassicae]
MERRSPMAGGGGQRTFAYSRCALYSSVACQWTPSRGSCIFSSERTRYVKLIDIHIYNLQRTRTERERDEAEAYSYGLRGLAVKSHKQKWKDSLAGGLRDVPHEGRRRGCETGLTVAPICGTLKIEHTTAVLEARRSSRAGPNSGIIHWLTRRRASCRAACSTPPSCIRPCIHRSPYVPIFDYLRTKLWSRRRAPRCTDFKKGSCQQQMSLPHPTALTSIHASLPHFLPSPALASPVGSSSSQPSLAAVSNAPCSTLFVANLGQFVSEHELKEIFNRNFENLHLKPIFLGNLDRFKEKVTLGGSPVAFVEYQDVRCAAQAMGALQGSLLVSSDRGAIRIEYAKSKMAEVGLTSLWIEARGLITTSTTTTTTITAATRSNYYEWRSSVDAHIITSSRRRNETAAAGSAATAKRVLAISSSALLHRALGLTETL